MYKMWRVMYTDHSIRVEFDDGDDVYVKEIPYEDVYTGISDAIKEDT